jgi:hypothetical protein
VPAVVDWASAGPVIAAAVNEKSKTLSDAFMKNRLALCRMKLRPPRFCGRSFEG